MGVGKTERAGLFDSRFTKGKRIDATNDRILRNIRVKGGSIRKVGDKWELIPSKDHAVEDPAVDGLKVCTFLDATTRQPKSISIKASDDAIIGNTEADGISLEDIQDGKIQIFNFDGDDTVALGLQDCLEVVKGTERIVAKTGEQYELLVRVKSDDGAVRALGYMSLGQSVDGEDPVNRGSDPCSHLDQPGGGAGGGGGPTENDGERTPPGGGDVGNDDRVATDRDNNKFPSKVGPCW